jgi:hypothetical protein
MGDYSIVPSQKYCFQDTISSMMFPPVTSRSPTYLCLGVAIGPKFTGFLSSKQVFMDRANFNCVSVYIFQFTMLSSVNLYQFVIICNVKLLIIIFNDSAI